MAVNRTYLALLRGINVGGNNPIRMADLKVCFEQLGLGDVTTFIQSGNVVFTTAEADAARLAAKVEAGLSKRFCYESRVVIVSKAQLARAVERAPAGFGKKPDTFRYDVIFLRPPHTPPGVIVQVPTREGVDEVHAGTDVLYFSRLIARASQSRLAKIVALPVYKDMTIRNWATTTKLLALMNGR
jgi:uncharacterized protein (DUF1697 family)